MQKMKLSELVLDFDLYPRAEVDTQHVHYMVEAISAGAELPPIIADKKSKRITDGFHRYRAMSKVMGPDGEVAVVLKPYPNDAAMFLDAMRYNAGDGRTLTTFDRAHSILRAEALGIPASEIAAALSITAEAVGKLRIDRVGTLRVAGKVEAIPLKRTIRHMSGLQLSQAQVDANAKLSGMEQLFYVNQLLTLIESDLIDRSNPQLMAALDRLAAAIGGPERLAA